MSKLGVRTGLAIGAATLVLAPVRVDAQEEATPTTAAASADVDEQGTGRWSGTRITTPATVSAAEQQLTADVKYAYETYPTGRDRFNHADLDLLTPAGQDPLCTPIEEVQTQWTYNSQRQVYEARESATLACNGAYTVKLYAQIDRPLQQPPFYTITLHKTLNVAMPGPPVTDVVLSKGAARSVTMSWSAPPDDQVPPDGLVGYLVERSVDGGAFAEVAVIDDMATTAHTDRTVPESGGKLAYRVSTLRDAPGGPVTSQATEGDKAVSFEAVPGSSTTSSAPDAGGSAVAASDTAGRRAGGSLDLPGVSSPNTSQGRGSTTPTTVDTGFLETLPFGDREPGEDEPSLPGDGFASVTFDEGGAGLLVPAAVALLLLVWAAHLRYLNRLAKG